MIYEQTTTEPTSENDSKQQRKSKFRSTIEDYL